MSKRMHYCALKSDHTACRRSVYRSAQGVDTLPEVTSDWREVTCRACRRRTRPVETRMVPQLGVTLDGVWFPMALLGALSEQRRYDSEWGSAFIDASPEQQRVLLAHNLAVKETRGGMHSSDTDLPEFLAYCIWPDGS